MARPRATTSGGSVGHRTRILPFRVRARTRCSTGTCDRRRRCSTGNIGRVRTAAACAGTPFGRGEARPGTARPLAAAAPWPRPAARRPRRPGRAAPRPSAGQRSGPAARRLGDEQQPVDRAGTAPRTRRSPPAAPKLRAVTTSNVPRSAGSRPAPRPGRCDDRRPGRRARGRRPRRAGSATRSAAARRAGRTSRVGQRSASTRPGTPPPLPRSSTRAGAPSTAATKALGVLDVVLDRARARGSPGRGPRSRTSSEAQRHATVSRRGGARPGGEDPRPRRSCARRRCSLTVSWTTLRSAAFIGSSAFCVPGAQHRLGAPAG